MRKWTEELATEKILAYNDLSQIDKDKLLLSLNNSFTPDIFETQLNQRREALQNLVKNQQILSHVSQLYPETISSNDIKSDAKDLAGYAIILTAGGEGERLRLSLLEQGAGEEELCNFTKATFPLPGFYKNYGALHANLSLIANICQKNNIDIPVIVTTGPKNSTTAKIIPQIIKEHNNFGLKNCICIEQDERLHFTQNEQIAYSQTKDGVAIVTNPDETGGPFMKLKKEMPDKSINTLEWLKQLGCNRIILLQATAVYNPDLIYTMATIGKKHDGVGVGIQRTSFASDDPYGTYVLIKESSLEKLKIVEKDVRNNSTTELKDSNNSFYLPFNTGFYVFDIDLLMKHDLPEYATPPKEVLPGIPKSPKTGYAATDILYFAKSPAVVTVSKDSFSVIKNVEDLQCLSNLGKQFNLDRICADNNEC